MPTGSSNYDKNVQKKWLSMHLSKQMAGSAEKANIWIWNWIWIWIRVWSQPRK